jgi:hypothetical protein
MFFLVSFTPSRCRIAVIDRFSLFTPAADALIDEERLCGP